MCNKELTDVIKYGCFISLFSRVFCLMLFLFVLMIYKFNKTAHLNLSFVMNAPQGQVILEV